MLLVLAVSFLVAFAVMAAYATWQGYMQGLGNGPVDLRILGVGVGISAVFVWLAYGRYQWDDNAEA